MTPKRTSKKAGPVKDYRHDQAKRKDNPPIGLVEINYYFDYII